MGKSDTYNYGVVLDAGSSGTRVYIYRWLKNKLAVDKVEYRTKLPELETKDKWTKKVHPGVSTFGNTPELVGPDHLKPLIAHALDYVPKASIADTPIFLLATAGMRLLPENQQNSVLDSICSYLQKETKFLLPDCGLHIQVIPGETEGLYGWIAANYLLGGFDEPQHHNHGKNHHTYGFLDMGGASAQIAFAPNQTEAEKHGQDLTLLRLRTVNGQTQEYRVFVTTWLGFGVNEARHRYLGHLQEAYAGESILEIPDPCLPKALKMTFDGKMIIGDGPALSHKHIVGTGKFDECLRRSYPLLEREKLCVDQPCLINGQHVPAIDFDVNHFIGISEYWHTTHEIFEMAHKDKSYDFNTYQQRVSEFCSREWSDIALDVADMKWGKKVDQQTAYEVCFKASWIINMLHDGIGIPRVGNEDTSGSHNGTKEVLESGKQKGYLEPFQAADKIKSTEISWTMGKMVLYASAAVPAAVSNSLPVGFGSNQAGVPANFQYPGGGRLQQGSDKYVDDQSITGKITDTLFQSDVPHRVPGFLFFLLIVVIAIFYLRRRRNSSPGDSMGSKRTTASSLISSINKLLGRPQKVGRYDRELEDGQQRLYDPNHFELGDMDSDEEAVHTDSDKIGSGYASPSIRRGKPSSLPLGRLTPDVMDRTGLVVRTESSERLDLNGRISRNASTSPTRLKT